MSRMDEAMQELVDAIKFSEEYIRYQDIKNRVHNQPQLEQQIHAFRHKNYLLQNSVEMWIFMMRRIRWNRNTVSFGKIHLSQNILQQKMLFAVWCRRSTGR